MFLSDISLAGLHPPHHQPLSRSITNGWFGHIYTFYEELNDKSFFFFLSLRHKYEFNSLLCMIVNSRLCDNYLLNLLALSSSSKCHESAYLWLPLLAPPSPPLSIFMFFFTLLNPSPTSFDTHGFLLICRIMIDEFVFLSSSYWFVLISLYGFRFIALFLFWDLYWFSPLICSK